MTSRDDGDTIDEFLGLDDPALPSVEVLTPSARNDVVEAEDDAEFARRNVRDAISLSKEALEVAIDAVTSSGMPKETEALSNLLDKFVQANEKLVNMTAKAAATKNGDGPAKVINNTQNVMVVGTTDDLLKAVRKARGEQDNEDLLQR